MTGFIVFAHGSRIESANQAVRDVAAQMAASGQHVVEAAFLELGQPDLSGATALLIARGARRIVVIPYFLTLGTHMQRDLPRLAARCLACSRRYRNANHFAARRPSRAGPSAARSRQRGAGIRSHEPSFMNFTTSRPKSATSSSKSPKSNNSISSPASLFRSMRNVNGKKITRPYSIVSLPDGNRFRAVPESGPRRRLHPAPLRACSRAIPSRCPRRSDSS